MDPQPAVLAAHFHHAAVHRRREVRAAAAPLLEERVGSERALEDALARRPATRRQERRHGRHQRRAAAAETELPLADEERARVDDDLRAEVRGHLGALRDGMERGEHGARVATRHLVPGDGGFPRRPLGERADDERPGLLAAGDPHLGMTVDRGDHRRGPHEDDVLAAHEELPRGAGGRFRHPITSAPRPGPHTRTRSTPGSISRPATTRGASPAAQRTFTCGPASMVK